MNEPLSFDLDAAAFKGIFGDLGDYEVEDSGGVIEELGGGAGAAICDESGGLCGECEGASELDLADEVGWRGGSQILEPFALKQVCCL